MTSPTSCSHCGGEVRRAPTYTHSHGFRVWTGQHINFCAHCDFVCDHYNAATGEMTSSCPLCIAQNASLVNLSRGIAEETE